MRGGVIINSEEDELYQESAENRIVVDSGGDPGYTVGPKCYSRDFVFERSCFDCIGRIGSLACCHSHHILRGNP